MNPQRPARKNSPKKRAGARTGAGKGRAGTGQSASGNKIRPSGRAKGKAAPQREKAGGDRGARRTGSRARQSPERGLGGGQVEGRQAVRELLLAGRRRVQEVLVAEHDDDFVPRGRPKKSTRLNEGLQDIVDLALDLHVPVREVSRSRLLREARTDAPQGVIAHAADLPEAELDRLTTATRSTVPFLVAVDGVTDPGNLGALVRSGECAGVTGFVLPRHRSVHITPAVTKASAGAVEYVPMAVVGGLASAISQMRDAGVWVVGLDAGGECSLFDLPVEQGQPVCLVLGSEGKGLSRLVRQRCDVVARLPLLGQLASLNVATAGTVACYEIARRRLSPGAMSG